jgi:myo-inositol-1(or 4)-monophosphatase
MKVAERDMPHAIVAFGTCPYYKDTLGVKTFELCYELYRACSDVRRPGAAALDLAYLAAGRNDIFFEIILSPWDIAAGNLLIKEAGGIITNEKGEDIDFSAPSCVLAASPKVYDEFYKIAKKVIEK